MDNDKETIKILADMTRQDMERCLETNAHYSQRYGWHLKRNSDLIKPLHILNEKSEQNSTTNN
jgi:hypothetical protein